MFENLDRDFGVLPHCHSEPNCLILEFEPEHVSKVRKRKQMSKVVIAFKLTNVTFSGKPVCRSMPLVGVTEDPFYLFCNGMWGCSQYLRCGFVIWSNSTDDTLQLGRQPWVRKGSQKHALEHISIALRSEEEMDAFQISLRDQTPTCGVMSPAKKARHAIINPKYDQCCVAARIQNQKSKAEIRLQCNLPNPQYDVAD